MTNSLGHRAAAPLDLEERAELALNALTRNVDPGLRYTLYFDCRLQLDPPVLSHHPYWDHCDGTGRTYAALLLAREMTGSDTGGEIDAHLQRLVASYQGEQGLCWIPAPDYPPAATRRPLPPVAEFWGQRGCLMAYVTAYQRSTDPGERATLRGRIDALIHGLKSIALERDGRLYYPVPPRERPVDADELFYPRGGWQGGDEPRGTGVMCAAAPVLRPIVQYLMTGARNPEAVALCDGLARYVVERADDFGPDGSFRGHFHSRVATAAGILLWGRYSEQPDLVRWAHAVYRFARTVGTSFGWFPEFVGEHACETCGITDMIDLAILLAGAGHPQYWSDAERFGRNHLAESQFLDAAWERQVPKLGATATAEFIDSCAPVQLNREGVRDVLPGAFSGGSAPNAVVDTRRGHWWMGCCNAHGVHGLFLLWKHAVQATRTAVRVNMLFNRSTPWADVRSQLPREGRVEVTMRQHGTLAVRIPDDVPRASVAVDWSLSPSSMSRSDRTDSPAPWVWNDGAVQVEGLRPGAKVTIGFPLAERDETTSVLGDEYRVSWRGDTVMAIDPPGRAGPLYRRRAEQATNGAPHPNGTGRRAARPARASRVMW